MQLTSTREETGGLAQANDRQAMRGGTLFSGIGAPEEAMPWIDWRWCAELEPFPSAVLEARHPRTKNLGDVTGVDWNEVAREEPVDLIVFGSPCQSFSVAGKRLGLGDHRGNLALVALGVVRTLRPRWFLFENVPGLLSSSGGRDFGSFLGAVEDCGYGWAFRIIDSQWFGVAQRRRRLFLAGYRDPVTGAGDWRPAAAVLFDRESLSRHPTPRRGPRQEVARALTASTGGASGKEQQLSFVSGDGRPLNPLCFGGGNTSGEIEVATCLTHHHSRQDFDTETFAMVGPLCAHSKEHGHAFGGQQAVEAGHIVPHAVGPLCTRSGGHTEQQAVEAGHIVTHALTARYDSSPDGTGRGVPLALHENQRGELTTSPSAGALKTGGGKPGQGYPAVCYPLDLRNAGRNPAKRDAVNRQGVGVGAEGAAAPACTAGPVAGVAYSFQPRIGRSGRGQPSEVVPALAGAGADVGATSDARPCVAVAAPSYAVRRLTPRECERLMGYPDDYTLVEFRGKPASDGARYRAIGNSMAVPVVAWIGRRIDLVTRLLDAG